ncbi:MAG: phosphotransferase [Verrucomicrobiota bacterium]
MQTVVHAENVEIRRPDRAAGQAHPDFLLPAAWRDAAIEPLTGDASARRYFRLRTAAGTAVLMDASRCRESLAPFLQVGEQLLKLHLSAPVVLARDEVQGYLLLEDFGDATFSALLDRGADPFSYLGLGVDLLTALHADPAPVPTGLRVYDVDRMLSDLELFLEWSTPGLEPGVHEEFRAAWRAVLPLAHRVPSSLLLRDYHAGNLMFLARRKGVRRVGLLDFQDAYAGPVTYDLVSLIEDARRPLPDDVRQKLIDRYLAQRPALDAETFADSLAAVAALRHTRVLAVFERLHRQGRTEYRERHSAHVGQLLRRALARPELRPVRDWMQRYAW